MRRTLRTLSFFVIAASLLAACSAEDSDEEKVGQATERLHKQIAEEKYQEMYQQTSPQFRRDMSEEAFVAMMGRLRRQVGRVQSIERVDINPPVRRYEDGTSLGVLDFHVNGDSGKCLEQVLWKIEDGKLLLERYVCDTE